MDETQSNNMGTICIKGEHRDEFMDTTHTNEDATKVEELLKILANHNVSTEGMDNASMRRFLRACAMDVKEATKMVMSDVAWRAIVVPPRGYVLENEVGSELHVGKAYLQGASKLGHPIILILAQHHFANKRHPLHFKRFVVYTLDKAIASAPKGVEKCLVIVDIKDTGYKNMDLKGMISSLQLLQNHYPERLAKLYFVNVSTFFCKFWKYATHFVDKGTLEKITFLPTGNMTQLLQDVDEDVLPAPYGGKGQMILIQDANVPGWPPMLQETKETTLKF